jgi:phage terminase large subunit
MSEVSLQQTIGKGYVDFWRFRGRYRVVKGAVDQRRVLQLLYGHDEAAAREHACYPEDFQCTLKWATRRLGVAHLWQFMKSLLEATYKPTGQKILFRGLDDPMSITSITVDTGYLCWAWFEEAYQISNEDDFDKIDMSIRGELPEDYFKAIRMDAEA